MGAGVMWHDAAIPHRSERVGGQHSSTRAELAAVVMALQAILIDRSWHYRPSSLTDRADDLAILIDSAAAIQRLRCIGPVCLRIVRRQSVSVSLL